MNIQVKIVAVAVLILTSVSGCAWYPSEDLYTTDELAWVFLNKHAAAKGWLECGPFKQDEQTYMVGCLDGVITLHIQALNEMECSNMECQIYEFGNMENQYFAYEINNCGYDSVSVSRYQNLHEEYWQFQLKFLVAMSKGLSTHFGDDVFIEGQFFKEALLVANNCQISE